jgi:all-trans-retinol 13,14-reductase
MTRIGTSYKQHPEVTRGPWDVIVIGSGAGGLATAGLLARHRGQRVLVLERHYTAGGFTHAFTRPGFEWDVGVHYIGEVNRPRSLHRRVIDHLTDGELAWASLGEVYDTIVIGEDRYELLAGREAFRERLHSYFPTRRREIDLYLSRIEATERKAGPFFLEKALPAPLAAVAGPLLRWPAMRAARRTVAEAMAEITSDPRLVGVLTGQYGDYGLPPGEASFFIHALVVKHYLSGAAYPVGGASRMAATMLPGIEAAGGAVVTNADVAEILIERGRATGVRLADGVELRAKSVISDAGWAVTFGRLVPRESMTRAQISAELPGLGPSASHVSLYIGLDRDAQSLGLPRCNIWVYPHHDHDANVARYIADPEAPLPFAYLSFPSARDPDFARRHPGKAAIEVVGLVPWAWFARWEDTRWHKRGADYDAFKARLQGRLLDELLRQCPQVRDHIVHAELSTPLSTRHFAAHPHGEIYGLAHTPNRFAIRTLRPDTAIPGLYLTGSDVCVGGVTGAVMGGMLTASVLARKNLLDAILGKRSVATQMTPTTT